MDIAFEGVALLMITKEELKEFLLNSAKEVDLRSLFPEETRKEDYRPYCKSEEDVSIWLLLPEQMDCVAMNMFYLGNLLWEWAYEGLIEYREKEGVAYKVCTNRYDIHLKVLHSGHVAQYMINRKTKRIANYSRSLHRDAIYNNIQKYI